MSVDIGFLRSRSTTGFPALQPFDWLAFDVETASDERSSICSIGVALVRDNAVIASGSQLIDPRVRFSPYNSAIHGLDEHTVRGAPTFAEFWPQLRPFLDGHRLVAHYASFDTGALRQAVARSELEGPTLEVLCSWRIAKRAWPEMPSHSLGWVAPALGMVFDHHQAGADAEACAFVILSAAEHLGVVSLDDLTERLEIRPGLLSPLSFVPIHLPTSPVDAASDGHHRMEGNPDAAPGHPFYGTTVCFTGGMFSMVRHEAAERVTALGAEFVNSMSAKVDFLVIGDADFVGFADGQRTGKIEKLVALREKGRSHAEVISERDFLTLLAS